ncbi:MAG: peptidase, partial [Odoribacter splanchnicus]
MSRIAQIRKGCRFIHRDLSYFFSGIIVIYAVSGIMLN